MAAALGDLIQQIDISDYRDALGDEAKHNTANLQAQAVVDEFGLTHEQLRDTLEDCDPEGDIREAARKLFQQRRAREAKPSDTPPEYDTWWTGP